MTIPSNVAAAAPSGEGGHNLLTSAQYLQSRRDGRAIYLSGERVADVTTHPGFRNAARSVARK